MSDGDIDRARLRTVRAKARLTDALQTLKSRLLPRTIARSLLASTTHKAMDAADAGMDAVRARPALVIGAAALGALFLSRKSIAKAISSEPAETPTASARSVRKSALRKPARKGST